MAEASKSNDHPGVRGGQVGPDLAIDAFIAPANASPGSTISVSDTIINYGGGAAGPFVVKFFLSTDDALDATDVHLGSRTVPGVAAGPPWATHSGTTALPLPTGLTGGTYYIIAVADTGGVVAEQDETNNVRARSIFIGADLVVFLDLPAASIFGAPGLPIAVTDSTQPERVAVGASTTTFYLSSDDPGWVGHSPGKPGGSASLRGPRARSRPPDSPRRDCRRLPHHRDGEHRGSITG
jgi:hypothetical protein